MSKTNLISFAQFSQVPVVPKIVPLDSVIEILTTEQVAENGVIVSKSKYVPDDSRTRYNGLSAKDFELSNLLDAGANLQPAKFTLNSFEAVGYAAYQAQKLSEFNKKVSSSKND